MATATIDITPHIPLVTWIASRYARYASAYRIERDDLISAGTLGLMKAGEKYDPERGFTFATYATWWIRQAIRRYLDDHARLVRVPVHRVDSTAKREALGTERVVWLDAHDAPALGSEDNAVDRAMARRDVAKLLNRIKSERTRAVVHAYYFGDMTMEQIGAPLGIGRERIRQLIEAGLEEMRTNAQPSRLRNRRAVGTVRKTVLDRP